MKQIIIASTSTLHGGGYLEYILPSLESLFFSCNEILFIPYARPGGISHDAYTQKAAEAFNKLGKRVRGLHEFSSPTDAIKKAEGIFTGGGNTFVLVNELYREKVMTVLSDVVKNGTPYLGTSAGSNICGLTMQTTNDMPIVYPPSFQTLGLVPFTINPHYLDPDPHSTHMGETRETRIREYHAYNSPPVVGLREGSWLTVKGDSIILEGTHHARIFRRNNPPEEIPPMGSLSDLQ